MVEVIRQEYVHAWHAKARHSAMTGVSRIHFPQLSLVICLGPRREEGSMRVEEIRLVNSYKISK